MTCLTIKTINEKIELREGESIREALQRQGIYIESPCDGQGICGQCGVWIEDPPDIPETPHENISQKQAKQGLRLSCQVIPEQDMTIRLPFDFTRDAKRSRDDQRILEGELFTRSRVVTAIKVFESKDGFWLQYDRVSEPQKMENWSTNFTPKGLAIDLGTTTLVVTLISLKTGEELATSSRLNPQIQFGHDVMTRIQHGSTPKGLEDLANAVQKGLNQLLEEVCEDSNSDPNEILDICIGGNTTMLQLAASIDPAPLGKVPFKVDVEGGTSYPVQKFGLEANPIARVYIPPIMHAFIGTDISAGLLMSEDFFDDERSVLYIDVGTNGELGLNIKGRRVVTSTAAGPAFEGMGLSCGMRAAVGAIETVNTNGYELKISTIGHAPVKGVCGSGIFDLLASLLRLGIIDKTGRIRNSLDKDLSPSVMSHLVNLDGQRAFRLGDDVYFTQKDIRQIQLAKGAIRAAIDILLEETESESSSLESIAIAGGFGFSLSPESLETIGLIPPQTKDKVTFTGNASRNGCVWLLTDLSYRRFLESRMTDMRHISIANRSRFMDHFVQSMEFPVLD